MANLVPGNRKNRGLATTGFEDLYNMLDDFFTDPWLTGSRVPRDSFRVDVQAADKEYIVEAELPGVHKDEVRLEMTDGNLSITVQRGEKVDEEGKNYIHRERRYASMNRTIYLGDAASEGIHAKLEGGVLHVTVPRQPQAENSRRIEIE
jgi:Molecular chaperone (small heat shock protein)